MLKQMELMIEELHRQLIERGCDPKNFEVHIVCKTLVEWSVFDQAIEKEIDEHYPEAVRVNRFLVPSFMTYKDTPIRIVYNQPENPTKIQ